MIERIIADCKKELEFLTSTVLSHAAKVHYATTNHDCCHIPKPKTDEAIRDTAYRFGWDITVENVVAGKALLRKLDIDL